MIKNLEEYCEKQIEPLFNNIKFSILIKDLI